MALGLKHSGTSHGVLRFQNPAAALQDYRKLGERKRVIRLEKRDTASVLNRLFRTTEFLQIDAQCQMGLHVVRCGYQNSPESLDSARKVSAFLQLVGRVVESVRIGVRVGHEDLEAFVCPRQRLVFRGRCREGGFRLKVLVVLGMSVCVHVSLRGCQSAWVYASLGVW